MSVYVCHLASNLKKSILADIKHLKKVLSHLKSNISLTFQYLGEILKLKWVIYSGAAHENLANGAIQGYLISLVGENSKCILLSWHLNRIRRVVCSLLAAETVALSDAVYSGVYMTKVLSEHLFNDRNCIPVEVITDSKSLYNALHSKKNVPEKWLQTYMAEFDLFTIWNIVAQAQPAFI